MLLARNPFWFEHLISERDHCSLCGESYLVDNMSLCTNCLGTYCYKCKNFPLGPNGNPVHACTDETSREVVG